MTAARRGRPGREGEAGGRERILAAATEVFAEKGFGETRVDEVAARAGVNKAMLYYHVGGKEELYAAVVSRVLDGVLSRLAERLPRAASPEERFRTLVATVGRAARGTPHFPRLILREVASGGEHLPPEVLRKIAGVFGAFRRVLDDGRAAGAFRPADPLLTHFLVGGSLLFLAASGPLRDRLAALEPRAGSDPSSAGPEAVADLFLDGLARPPRGARTPQTGRTARPKGAPR